MRIKVNDKWFYPDETDKVMIEFEHKEEKDMLLKYLQSMPEDISLLALFPSDSMTKEEIVAWMHEE